MHSQTNIGLCDGAKFEITNIVMLCHDCYQYHIHGMMVWFEILGEKGSHNTMDDSVLNSLIRLDLELCCFRLSCVRLCYAILQYCICFLLCSARLL